MKLKSAYVALATLSLTLMAAGCAPPADQTAEKEAAQQAADLQKAQDDLAKAQADAAEKDKELEAAKARAASAARESRRERAPAQQEAAAPPPVCNDCGTIVAINEVRAKGKGSGMGAVAGAVLGGVIGHQIGGGHGQDIATGVGAVAGGFGGNAVEQQARATTYYQVDVRMDTGGERTVKVDSAANLSVGTPVRVQGDNIALR